MTLAAPSSLLAVHSKVCLQPHLSRGDNHLLSIRFFSDPLFCWAGSLAWFFMWMEQGIKRGHVSFCLPPLSFPLSLCLSCDMQTESWHQEQSICWVRTRCGIIPMVGSFLLPVLLRLQTRCLSSITLLFQEYRDIVHTWVQQTEGRPYRVKWILLRCPLNLFRLCLKELGHHSTAAACRL